MKRKRLVERLWAVKVDGTSRPFFGYGGKGRATFFSKEKAQQYELECRRHGVTSVKVVPVEIRELEPKRKPKRKAVRR